MPKLLEMKSPRRPRGESVLSLIFGVPSLAIAAGAVTLLVSYMIDHPVGPAEFQEVVHVGVRGATGAEQSAISLASARSIPYILPSMHLLGMLGVGMGLGCLGMLLGRRRRHRGMTTCTVGAIACTLALALAWILYARAAVG